jgi:SAM-dependent methyltransferase
MRLLLAFVLAACSASPPPPQPPAPAHHDHAGFHHRFEHADQWAPVFDDPARDAWQEPDRVVAALALAPGMAVADIGAGTGYFEKRLAAAVGGDGHVFALDVEPDMVRYMRERATRDGTPNVEPRVAQPDDPGLAPASVDRILIVDTWHHIDDRPAYARKLAAALKPGGFLLIVDFRMDSPTGPPPEHRVHPEQVAAELAEGGLGAAVLSPNLPRQVMIKGAPQR